MKTKKHTNLDCSNKKIKKKKNNIMVQIKEPHQQLNLCNNVMRKPITEILITRYDPSNKDN